jgi:hypothetical protein
MSDIPTDGVEVESPDTPRHVDTRSTGEGGSVVTDDGTDGVPTITLPATVVEICSEFDVNMPRPGETWKFTLENTPTDRDIGRELVGAGCELCMEVSTGDGGRTYEYEVPEPGWPEPLGYITTDEPKFVSSQNGWKDTEKFYGNVRGSIPDGGDCNRHPDLPENAYALTTVIIYGPSKEPKFHAKPDLIVPEGVWTVNLTYEQASNGKALVEVYSSELGPFPDCTQWKTLRGGNRDERRRVEFFDTRNDAVQFVHAETGLTLPELPNTHKNQH